MPSLCIPVPSAQSLFPFLHWATHTHREGPAQMSPTLGRHLLVPHGQSLPALGPLSPAQHSGLASSRAVGLRFVRVCSPQPPVTSPSSTGLCHRHLCSRGASVIFWVCFLSIHSFNKAQPWSFLSTPDFPRDPSHVSSPTRRGPRERLVTAPSLPPGDNKPIWMHAEEREESKVALWGRAGAGTCGGRMRPGVCRGEGLLPPSASLSPRISAGTAPPMANMAAGTRPVK